MHEKFLSKKLSTLNFRKPLCSLLTSLHQNRKRKNTRTACNSYWLHVNRPIIRSISRDPNTEHLLAFWNKKFLILILAYHMLDKNMPQFFDKITKWALNNCFHFHIDYWWETFLNPIQLFWVSHNFLCLVWNTRLCWRFTISFTKNKIKSTFPHQTWT